MKIRLLKIMAGRNGAMQPGTILDMGDDDDAIYLIARGYAELAVNGEPAELAAEVPAAEPPE